MTIIIDDTPIPRHDVAKSKSHYPELYDVFKDLAPEKSFFWSHPKAPRRSEQTVKSIVYAMQKKGSLPKGNKYFTKPAFERESQGVRVWRIV